MPSTLIITSSPTHLPTVHLFHLEVERKTLLWSSVAKQSFGCFCLLKTTANLHPSSHICHTMQKTSISVVQKIVRQLKNFELTKILCSLAGTWSIVELHSMCWALIPTHEHHFFAHTLSCQSCKNCLDWHLPISQPKHFS